MAALSAFQRGKKKILGCQQRWILLLLLLPLALSPRLCTILLWCLRFRLEIVHFCTSHTLARKVKLCIFNLKNVSSQNKLNSFFPGSVCHTFFSSSSSKSNVVILPMIHQALDLHKYKETKSLRADSSPWHFFSPSHSSLPEDLKEWVKAYISQTILPSPGERSASSTTPLLVIFFADNEESGSTRAVNTSLRPPSHRLKHSALEINSLLVLTLLFRPWLLLH